ncbi:MAG: tetratricopeptide repeat protein [Magnetococcales bacterium]|nr:tetratricopeptide repeat protein [Magnetococcales bacterium]
MTVRSHKVLDDVLARLQRMWVSDLPVEMLAFEQRRLEQIVRPFCRTDPVRAYYLLGVLATLRGDVDETRSRFNNALRHSNHDADVRRGYGVCLMRLRHFAEARGQYEAIFAEDQEDLGVLAELIVTSLATGRIQDGVRWIQRWSELNPDRPFEEAETISKSAALLEKFGISDDHVERLQRLALGILERELLNAKAVNYRGVPFDDPEWIEADVVVDESESVVEGLNGKLSRVLTTNAPPPRLAEVIKFTYLSGTSTVP